MTRHGFSTLIVIKPDDFQRQMINYKRLVANLRTDRLFFVSSEPIKEYIKEADLGEAAGFIDESSILPFADVHKVMCEHLREILGGEDAPRGATGWYYQQFLKMQYAYHTEDEYYMVWDGDTIPCREISMFKEGTGEPYLDLKYEYHEAYFKTLETLLPGMQKCIRKSFISEHMLFNTKLMRMLIERIERNDAIKGNTFWEKIIHAIPPAKVSDSAFSEFETYGTFVCFTEPALYKLREWHSFRLGAEFFHPERMTEEDYAWLGRDFDAISFEKNQFVRPENDNLFNNKEYQTKLSARQMLEIAQEEFKGGYIEVWDDSLPDTWMDPLAAEKNAPEEIKKSEDELYEAMGDSLLHRNLNQAFLCYENAAFLSDDEELKKRCTEKMDFLKADERCKVQKTAFAIINYNQKSLLQHCIWSIEEHCAPTAYSIIVVDNGSADGSKEWLQSQSGKITFVQNNENLGFTKGCNACIENADPKEDIFLLNNDTRMTHNALFWLRMGLYEDVNVGAAGCMGSYSGNDQMVALKHSDPGSCDFYAKKVNVPMANPYEEKSRLCGFAMLIKREVLDLVGNMDEAFSPGYFEDDDLSLRIRQAGYRLLVCHNSFIYHKGSASFQNKADVDDVIIRNYKYIQDKWSFDCFAVALISKNEKDVLKRLPDKSFRLLEIGCGMGNFLSMIKYNHPDAQLYGIDTQEEAIRLGVAEIPRLLCDFTKDELPFPKHYFDVIVVKQKGDKDYTPEFLKEKLADYIILGGQLLLSLPDHMD